MRKVWNPEKSSELYSLLQLSVELGQLLGLLGLNLGTLSGHQLGGKVAQHQNGSAECKKRKRGIREWTMLAVVAQGVRALLHASCVPLVNLNAVGLHLVHELGDGLFVLLLGGQINDLVDGIRVGEASQNQLFFSKAVSKRRRRALETAIPRPRAPSWAPSQSGDRGDAGPGGP